MADEDKLYHRAIADLLTRHGIAKNAEDVTAANLEEHVVAFQEAKKIFADGRIGPVTLWTLQYDFALSDKKLKMVSTRADKPARPYEGYSRVRLREDAAAAFDRLAQRVRAAGGLVTTSGGLRGLGVKPNANQSATSFHYTGLAFDLAVSTGSFDLARDPFVIQWAPERARWIVWARAEGGQEQQFEATLHQGKWTDLQVSRQMVTGKFVNVTELAAAEGFQPIGPRPNYRRAQMKAYMSSEWWHFQYEAALTPKVSQFGVELLKVDGYDSIWHAIPRGLEPNGVWANRRFVFKSDWN